MKVRIVGVLYALGLLAFLPSAAAAICDGTPSLQGPALVKGGTLTLEAVIAEIHRASPAVRSAGLEISARKAEAAQAARWLNPSLSIDVENFGGDGALSGTDNAESTYALEQTFQLGGKRRYSARTARAYTALATADCAVILREAELQASLAYYELLAARDIAGLTQEAANLAEQLAEVVEKRVRAGAAAPPDLARAKTEAATARALATGAEVEVTRMRYALAVFWGDAEADFKLPQSSSESGTANPLSDKASSAHPLLQQAEAAERALAAQKRLEQARALPDITLSAGYRQFEASGENALVAGLSVPLPLFDRNRDAVRAADYRLSARAVNRQAMEAQILAQQRATIASLKAARSRLTQLQEEALPAARQAYDASLRGYSVGKFDLTSTIDARRALIETQLAAIEAALSLHMEDMRLRSLIGATPFDGDRYE